MRQEHDGLGTMELPDEAYWGIVSERNKEAFDVGPLTLDDYAPYMRAVALCKIACTCKCRNWRFGSRKAKIHRESRLGNRRGKTKRQFHLSTFTEARAHRLT